ncbi:MAG: copper amine oxidase N-terminal domain-containing protein [Clostridia bacterium]|nr:copper amine oxidase N-terminal domain-containing protein [Clostridia bacterium]
MKNKILSLILSLGMTALLVMQPCLAAAEQGDEASITFMTEVKENSVSVPDTNDNLTKPVPLFNDVNEILVTFCGSLLDFEQPPVNEDGRVLVPMREIFEAMGMAVDWDEASQKVTATSADKAIELTIGDSTAYVNGEALTLDVSAKIIAGHTLVPVRFIAESSGYRVQWDTTQRPRVVIMPDYSPEVYASLRSLIDECMSEDILEWIISLYDPETSAFYFKKSAKETEGFLPDRESTSKCLRMLETLGVLDTKNLSEVYTDEMLANLTAFAQQDQSDEDGYWYEKPWGQYIGESKKLYASGGAGQVLAMTGGKPLYPTAGERIAQDKAGGETAAAADLSDNKFNSHEDYKKWFEEGLGWTNPYGACSLLLSNLGGTRAAGDDYYDLAIELLFNKISPNTGLPMTKDAETGEWLELVNNDSMSGGLKASSVICESHWPSLSGRDYAWPYFDKAIRSTIEVILADETRYHACDITNAWVLLRGILYTQNNINNVPEYRAAYDYYMAKLPEMIDKTKERVLSIKTEDGSYTYYSGRGSGMNQNVISALCHEEGELSGASMIVALFGNIYDTLFLDQPKFLGDKYTPEDIRNKLLAVEPTKKIEFATNKTYTFDDYELGNFTNLDGMRVSGDISIAEDKEYWGEYALRAHADGTSRPYLTFDVGTNASKGFTLEFDMKFEAPAETQALMVFEFGGFEHAVRCGIRKQNGTYVFNRTTDKGANIKQGFDWTDYHKLKIVYNVDGETATTDFYFDGQLINSGGFYNNGYTNRPPVQNIPCINFRADHDSPFTMYIDNLSFAQHE